LADEIDEPGVVYLLAHVGRELSRAVISSLTGETLVATEPDVGEADAKDHYRQKIAAALALPDTHPHVASWFRSYQALVARAHWRSSTPRSEEVREAFRELAGLLFGRIAPYFDTLSELDRLLQIERPTESDVERLKQCLSRYTQRQYFFSRLAKPGWLPLLAQEGFFRNPPDRQVHDDQSWSIQSWPEGEALARLAAEAPDIVVSEFSAIPKDNSNPAVWNDVATAALALSPAVALRLVPLLIHALKHAPAVLFPRPVVGVIQMLAHAGERDAAFGLTETLLFVRGVGKPGTTEAGVQGTQ
jgi:hypothetical protein